MTQPNAPTDQKPRDWSSLHLWQIQGLRDLLLVALIIGLLHLGSVLSVVTVPLLIGLGLAYAFEPLIGAVAGRWHWASRGRQIVVMVCLSLLCVSVLSVVTLPRLTRQAASLISNRQEYATQAIALLDQDWMPLALSEALTDSLHWVAGHDSDLIDVIEHDAHDQEPTPINENNNQGEEHLRTLIRQEIAGLSSPPDGSSRDLGRWWAGSRQVARTALAVFGGALDLLLFAFLTLFFWVSFSASFPAIRDGLWNMVPLTIRPRWQDLAGKMDNAISGFIRGRILICLIMGLGYAIGWSMVGVPYALLLSLLAAALGLIPFAAGIVLPLAWGLLAVGLLDGALSTGLYLDEENSIRWLALLFWPGLIFVIIQIADEYVLTPIIQGHSTQLEVTAIIIAIIAGGSLAGFYGMLLAIPSAACLRILWVEVAKPHFAAWCNGQHRDPLPLDDGEQE